jgi:hypothetical protein
VFRQTVWLTMLLTPHWAVMADESAALIAACRSAMEQTESLLADGEMSYVEEIHFIPSGQRDVIDGRIAWDAGFRFSEIKHHYVREGKTEDEEVRVVKTHAGALSIVNKHFKEEDRTITLANFWAKGATAKIYNLYNPDVPNLWFDERLGVTSRHIRYFQERAVSQNGRVTYDRKIELLGDQIECRISYGKGTRIRFVFSLKDGGNMVLRESEEPAHRYAPNGEHGRLTYEWGIDESGRYYPVRTLWEVGSGLKDGKLASVAMRHSFTVNAISKRKMEIPRSVDLTTLGEIPEGTMVSKTYPGGAREGYVFRKTNADGGIEETLKRQAGDLQKKGLGAKMDSSKK